MKFFSSLIILLLLVVLVPFTAFGQRYDTPLATSTTIATATPQFFPDGAVTVDSAWIINTKYEPNYSITLFAVFDSVASYDATDDSIRIDVIFASDSPSVAYYPLNLTSQNLMNSQLAQAGAPADSGYWFSVTAPAHNRRRYRVATTLGTPVKVTLKEEVNTAGPFKFK